ncbi:MAG: hypothetical protein HWD58_13450 [Bacteroidota bacterium]|nr:MAG: hypothetical protein HWD58_13450 [Bacteroidota bacterium]
MAWYRGGNLPTPGFENIFGTFWNSEVHHYTNGIRRFTTSTNNGLSNTGFSTPMRVEMVSALRIMSTQPPLHPSIYLPALPTKPSCEWDRPF